MDGTPILDIKPYLPYVDCMPDARGGFADRVKGYALEVEIPEKLLLKLPNEQQGCVREILAEDPRPSYQNDPDRVYGMEYAGYEIKFRVKDYRLTVCEIERAAADRTIKMIMIRRIQKVKYYLAPLEELQLIYTGEHIIHITVRWRNILLLFWFRIPKRILIRERRMIFCRHTIRG